MIELVSIILAAAVTLQDALQEALYFRNTLYYTVRQEMGLRFRKYYLLATTKTLAKAHNLADTVIL
jgi:hypothetical protein